MPGSSKAKHPSGVEIEFFEDSHKYVSFIKGHTIEYSSGTQFVHHFFPAFDVDGKIAERCAAKEGCTVEDIKAKWAKAGREASTLGTKVHECCEDVVLGKAENELRNRPDNPKEAKIIANAVNMAKRFYSRLDILGVEKIVFSPSLKIAGTIDLFARSRKDGTYLVLDWKTNKSIDVEDKWNTHALGPISHLPATNYIQYSGQLNLYQYLLQKEGYVPHDAKFKRYLIHVTEQEAKLIELPNMQLEIRDMFISWMSGEEI